MTFLICLIGTLCLVPILRRLAIETNFVDIPDDRKHHDGLIPPIGGIAIFIPFLVLSGVYAFQADLLLQDIWPFFTAVIMLLLLGVVDDKYHINANFKFLVHFLAAILVVYNGANLSSMGNLFGYGESNFGWFAPIFSVFCVVYLINAINMIDGIDGLSCGLGVIMTGYLILACMLAGLIPPAGLYMLAGGLVGYLWYNMRTPFRSSAIVFLGDAGSMVLGLILAWYAMTLSQNPEDIFQPITVAWILALPIWDAFGMLTARIRQGRRPFTPDRNHFHHHFLAAGFTQGQATPLIIVYSALLGAIGVFLPKAGFPYWMLTYMWIFMWLVHAQLSHKPAKFIAFLRRIRVRVWQTKHAANS